jgi:hypothetical protein
MGAALPAGLLAFYLWLDGDDVILDLTHDNIFNPCRKHRVEIGVRLAGLVVLTRQLEKAKSFDLDQFGRRPLFAPDIAKAEKVLESRANRDHQAGDDQGDREDLGLIAQYVQLPQAEECR